MRSRYTWTDDGVTVRIVDQDMGGFTRSVTNDAECVIRDLAAFGIAVDRRQIIYRDSNGLWFGMRTRAGEFAGFLPLGDQAGA